MSLGIFWTLFYDPLIFFCLNLCLSHVFLVIVDLTVHLVYSKARLPLLLIFEILGGIYFLVTLPHRKTHLKFFYIYLLCIFL